MGWASEQAGLIREIIKTKSSGFVKSKGYRDMPINEMFCWPSKLAMAMAQRQNFTC
jgi:hypothetical protein